jgi:glycosyltransferase involved in cell wall biosynthesis
MSDLTFVVPAYGESPYLHDCLRSLCDQTATTEVIITTSTPNDFLEKMAEEFSMPILVNAEGGSISRDWNFALKSGQSKLVALAHQDDLYHPEFARQCCAFFADNPDCAISFTDMAALINNHLRINNIQEWVKKFLRESAFLGKETINSSFQYRRLLGFGCAIPCPSVVYNLQNIPDFIFSDQYSINIDWDAWTRIAFSGQQIGYIRGSLMTHRIHKDAETQKGLADKRRDHEDYLLFSRYWPGFIARTFLGIYRFGYKHD